MVPFVQFKKGEKHLWRSVNFSTKINTPPWLFFTFFKLYKWHQIAQRITYTPLYPQPCYVNKIFQQVFDKLIHVHGEVLKPLLSGRFLILHVRHLLWFSFYHCQMSPFYIRCPSMILKLVQDFLKLACFPLFFDESSG